MVEEPRQRLRSNNQHKQHKRRGLSQGDSNLPRKLRGLHLARTKHHRQHHQDQDGGKVLYNQPSRGDASAARLIQALIRKVLDKDHGRCNGHGEAQHDTRLGRPPKSLGQAIARQRAQRNLDDGARHGDTFDLGQVFK